MVMREYQGATGRAECIGHEEQRQERVEKLHWTAGLLGVCVGQRRIILLLHAPCPETTPWNGASSRFRPSLCAHREASMPVPEVKWAIWVDAPRVGWQSPMS